MRKATSTSSKKIDVDSVAKLKESLLAAKEKAKTTKPSFKVVKDLQDKLFVAARTKTLTSSVQSELILLLAEVAVMRYYPLFKKAKSPEEVVMKYEKIHEISMQIEMNLMLHL
jgi:hypothetical protein